MFCARKPWGSLTCLEAQEAGGISYVDIAMYNSSYKCVACLINIILIPRSFFKNYLFIYLFMAVLGLRFCARAFSSCGKRGPLFIAVRGPHYRGARASHYRGLSRCGAQAPDVQAQ